MGSTGFLGIGSLGFVSPLIALELLRVSGCWFHKNEPGLCVPLFLCFCTVLSEDVCAKHISDAACVIRRSSSVTQVVSVSLRNQCIFISYQCSQRTLGTSYIRTLIADDSLNSGRFTHSLSLSQSIIQPPVTFPRNQSHIIPCFMLFECSNDESMNELTSTHTHKHNSKPRKEGMNAPAWLFGWE